MDVTPAPKTFLFDTETTEGLFWCSTKRKKQLPKIEAQLLFILKKNQALETPLEQSQPIELRETITKLFRYLCSSGEKTGCFQGYFSFLHEQ